MPRSRARSAGFLLATLVVVGACSAEPGGAASPTPATPTSAPSPTGQPPVPTAPSSDGSSGTPSDQAGDPARFGDWTALQPCDLLGEAAVATVIGTLAGEPSGSEAAGGGHACTWTSDRGDTVTIATADPETFEAMREAAYEPKDVPGLGSAAYRTTVGQREQLVVHGGSVVLVVESSQGPAVAEAAARAMLAVLEVL